MQAALVKPAELPNVPKGQLTQAANVAKAYFPAVQGPSAIANGKTFFAFHAPENSRKVLPTVASSSAASFMKSRSVAAWVPEGKAPENWDTGPATTVMSSADPSDCRKYKYLEGATSRSILKLGATRASTPWRQAISSDYM